MWPPNWKANSRESGRPEQHFLCLCLVLVSFSVSASRLSGFCLSAMRFCRLSLFLSLSLSLSLCCLCARSLSLSLSLCCLILALSMLLLLACWFAYLLARSSTFVSLLPLPLAVPLVLLSFPFVPSYTSPCFSFFSAVFLCFMVIGSSFPSSMLFLLLSFYVSWLSFPLSLLL